MKRLKLLLALFLIVNIAFAQTPKKEHYIVHSTKPGVNLEKYYTALDNWSHLDEYRFYDTRRVINFVDDGISVELYSAKELKQIYGKEIPPGTIMPQDKYMEVSFAVTLDGKGIKPQAPIKR